MTWFICPVCDKQFDDTDEEDMLDCDWIRSYGKCYKCDYLLSGVKQVIVAISLVIVVLIAFYAYKAIAHQTDMSATVEKSEYYQCVDECKQQCYLINN